MTPFGFFWLSGVEVADLLCSGYDADFAKIQQDVAILSSVGGYLPVQALRDIYALHQSAYCGEYSDGESSHEDFKWACERHMAKAGHQPSPRNWALAAVAAVPADYVFGPW
jgi:hypothetical protein